MKKERDENSDEMRPEYDFSKLKFVGRGIYAKRYDEIKILDVVALMEDMPEQGLRRGEVGTVVDRWKDGVFEVEFSDDSGEAYSFAAVPAEKLMKLYFRKGEAT